MIILTTIDFVHQNKLKNKFNNEYSMMGDFRLFYRKLYHLISSFLNVMCIAISPKNKEIYDKFFDDKSLYSLPV